MRVRGKCAYQSLYHMALLLLHSSLSKNFNLLASVSPQHRSRFIFWLTISWFCFHGIDPFSCSLKVVSSQGKQNCPSFSIKSQIFKWLGSAQVTRGFPGGSDGEESTCGAGDPGSISGLGRSPEEGNDYPFQYSCLENPMDRGAWQATVHGVANNQTQLIN